MAFIDLHCDTLLKCHVEGASLNSNNCHVDLEKLSKGDAMAQCFAIWIPSGAEAVRYGVTESPYEFFQSCYQTYRKELKTNSHVIAEARSVADIERNQANGKISSVLTIEDGELINGKIERLNEFWEKGVRMLGMTWNYENCLGYPQSSDEKTMKKGLKPFGIETLSKMNEIGIVADVSHMSQGGFYDVARHSTKPFVASHSNARSISGWSRNLTDDQLRTLAEHGGVCGVTFFAGFLTDCSEIMGTGEGADLSFEQAQAILGSMQAEVKDIIRMIRYIRNVAGVETVAFGSDFDGIPGEVAFRDYSGMAQIKEMLNREFPAWEVEMFCSGNAMRLFKDVIGE